MRALRVVGITEGGGELSVVLEDAARQERFTVPADEQLRAAARGDLTRLGQISIELESQLRPREIQARIRAGASVDQVAAAAGVPPQKIERFAYPVLLERSRTAEVAQRAHPMRADGPDGRMLGDVVAHTFGLRGQEYPSAEWDSWKGDDGRWVIALSWRAGRSDNRALWTFQPGAHGGTVTALDEHAHDLVEGLPARPLRTVGPVIDISRPDEPAPAPDEGRELRAAASDTAARRDVPDWSRGAPEPRRPEPPRRSAPSVRTEPAEALHRSGWEEPGHRNGDNGSARPARADEPATEWPVPPWQSADRDQPLPGDGPAGRAGEATTAAPVEPPAPRRADAGTAPTATARAELPPTASPRADDTPQAPRQTDASPSEPRQAEPATRQADAPPTAPRQAEGATRQADAPPTAPRRVEPQNTAPRQADAAARQAEPAATTDPAEPTASPADAVAPAPRQAGAEQAAPGQAEPAAAPEAGPATPATPAPPRRNRKGKPVMPSWDEVLLGVRGQR